MYHFAFSLQFSISYLILVISKMQFTANDEPHDTKPAEMILRTAKSVNFTTTTFLKD